jgi:hypothetical protein
MNGQDYAPGVTLGGWTLLGRSYPGGRGPARRYRLRCGDCAAERVITHGELTKALRRLRRGLAAPACPCAAATTGRRARTETWGRRRETCYTPAAARLPAGTISAAAAWPVPGRVPW